uniref:NADH-ubiquinone oxidoreductase chain 3 n=1 Tax=Paratemnoides elongatus TaxID=51805 RepID=H9MFH5_9ARAC|nr:NADH dehydrogenase subunit 3 [Paratemnoides elongatus]AEX37720.1 NADH dehydrogenase subunit 3 [Paratemnoides elongatus]
MIMIMAFLLIIMTLFILLFMIGFITNKKAKNTMSKPTPFECGMELINPVYMYFSIQFYVICIVFIVFDLEILFLIPYSSMYFMSFNLNTFFMYFFTILSLSFIYEWVMKSINWV